MASNLMTNDELRGVRVLGGKNGTSHIGKVRRLVFHPRERRVVGFIVKRPDLALMFHRKDLFVSINGFDIVDGRVVVRQTPDATDKGACKALGIDWDTCVMWEGLPLMTESGETLGMVGTVLACLLTGVTASTYCLSLSLLLAFAMLYPEVQLLLFFVIPIRVKYFGFFAAALWVFSFLSAPLAGKLSYLLSMLNVWAFFGPMAYRSVRAWIRREQWKRKNRR